jgi:hypothetical protein
MPSAALTAGHLGIGRKNPLPDLQGSDGRFEIKPRRRTEDSAEQRLNLAVFSHKDGPTLYLEI